MIWYDYYADIPSEAIEGLVRESELGRLVSVSADGLPDIGLYPFVYEGGAIELHLNRADPQLAQLQARPRCLFEIDDVLGVIPSYWIHAEDAVMATAYHRTLVFECEASLSEDAAALAEQQMRLLARYQPEGGFRPVAPGHPLYRAALGRIAALQLRVRGRRVKFKLGQNRSREVRANIVRELRQRGRRNDSRAADALQWTIDHETRR